jgi:hypothetical protein
MGASLLIGRTIADLAKPSHSRKKGTSGLSEVAKSYERAEGLLGAVSRIVLAGAFTTVAGIGLTTKRMLGTALNDDFE